MTKNQSKTKRARDGLVRLDPEKLERLRLRKGLSKTMLATQADVSRNTLLAVYQNKGLFAASAKMIATALGVSVDELRPHQNDEEATGNPVYALPATEEWEPLNYLSSWKTASNGLQYRICRMRHRHIDGPIGRGKFYDLLEVPTADREAMREMLARHANTAGRIESHLHVATTLSAVPVSGGQGWWVIDRWLGQTTLAERFASGRLPPEELPRVMREIALGLEALHAAKIVLRELAPPRVLLAENDGRAVLSEFELAKFLDAAPTVSADWPPDAYRAEEVESGNFDERADFYSWARILVEAASGELPAKGQDVEVLTGVGLPQGVCRIAADCLSPVASERPRSIKRILKAVRSWQ